MRSPSRRTTEEVPGPAAGVAAAAGAVDLAALAEVQRRVLWLATRMVDAANHDRDTGDGVKVGGHQASSASLVTAMTALYFAHLDGADRVSVKPHASPVLHAISYLLGDLDRRYLTGLRALGGLQSYPSRTKDPDRVDFSTGSVGLGAVAPLFAAATRRYVDAHFGDRPASRFVALIGDAELDEGNVWEAILDPSTEGLGNVMWVVDLNRQSLDRVIPGVKARRLESMFEAAGWHVLEAKYGEDLEAAFRRPGGDQLRQRIDEMSNEEYQSLFGLAGSAVRERLAGGNPGCRTALSGCPDDELGSLVANLGGHDLASMLAAYAAADADPRPTVVFAYTVKGWGLPIAGDPLNHSALLTTEQVSAFREAVGLSPEQEWDRFEPASAPGRLCAAAARRLQLAPPASRPALDVPTATAIRANRPTSTQEAFGRIVADVGRSAVGNRVVTLSPDVSVSTNLGGWINRVGVFAPQDVADWLGPDRLLRWRQRPQGQHIELGISEMNLFCMLGQLGLSWDLSGTTLLPIGTLYDPFVCRGLDALIYATYSGARFVVVGTPSGITLAPEGGAHQSTVTASIGVELPGLTFAEPAYAVALDWLLCDALGRIADLDVPDPSVYLRLSTRPLDQRPFAAARERMGEDELRRQVLAGGYVLRPAGTPAATGRPAVRLAASGAVMPEALLAAQTLEEEGVPAEVVDVTSLGRLHREWAAARAESVATLTAPRRSHVQELLTGGVPLVTVHDAATHAMSWLGAVAGAPMVPLGVDRFGQSGSVAEVYGAYGLSADHVVNAALVAVAGA